MSEQKEKDGSAGHRAEAAGPEHSKDGPTRGHRLEDVVLYRDWKRAKSSDSGLSPEGRAEFEAHLAGCEACRASLRAAEAALSALDDLLSPEAAPPDKAGDGSIDRALAAMRRGEGAAKARRRRQRILWPALTVGFAAAAALLVALLFGRGSPPAPAPARTRMLAPARPEK